MLAHEGVQSADVLDRNDLVEQVERFLGTQAHQVAKTPAVLREFVKYLSAPDAQLLTKVRNIVAYSEMVFDIQRRGCDDKEFAQVALLPPEDLGQRHALLHLRIGKGGQYDGICIFGAQILHIRRTALAVLLLTPSPAYIRSLITLTVLFSARCLVVGSPGVWDEQGEQSIGQGGLARAIRASIHLKPLQTKPA